MSPSPWWLADAAAQLAAARERRGEAIGHPCALERAEDTRRDYIQEAGAIARGESRILPELEHVRALVDALGGMLIEFTEADRRNQSILLGFERGDYYYHERQERIRILLARLEVKP